MNDTRSCLLVLLALVPSSAAAGAQPALATVAAEPSRPFVSVQADGRLSVRGADGAALVEIEALPGLESPTLSPAADGWVFTATYLGRARREILLLHRGSGAAPVRIPAPPDAQGKIRTQPIPLVREDRLAGLAWLEGDDRQRLSVRAAAWSGEAWEAVDTVAEPAVGTQTALAGAILDDGSWILAWSAFDGTDDDVLISLRRHESWSQPGRAHPDNATPDVTPAVIPYHGGARLAWSQFDGKDYRLMLATLRAARITDLRTVGDPGAVLPVFPARAGGEQLLYRSVRPYGWTLLEIDATARAWRRAQFPDATFGDRAVPEVASDTTGAVLFWPERGRRLERPWEPVL